MLNNREFKQIGGYIRHEKPSFDCGYEKPIVNKVQQK